MTTEHDEALVERVALAMRNEAYKSGGRGMEREQNVAAMTEDNTTSPIYWRDLARDAIYPPAPPKTRLQVARELCAGNWPMMASEYMSGKYDDGKCIAAVLAALALPAMED